MVRDDKFNFKPNSRAEYPFTNNDAERKLRGRGLPFAPAPLYVYVDKDYCDLGFGRQIVNFPNAQIVADRFHVIRLMQHQCKPSC